jgi:hypothetical protein
MPWDKRPMKDAASGDTLRVGASNRRSGDFRMGKPATHWVALPPEYIGRVEGTGRTETSKYPEEEKTKVIPSVAASESGTA